MSVTISTKAPNEINVRIEVTAHVALDPSDWRVATWRPRTALPRPEAQPFDLDGCISRLQKVVPGRGGYYAPWEWGSTSIASSLSPPEAHFWFVAMTECSPDNKPHAIAPLMKRMHFTGEIPPDEIKQRLRQRASFVPERALDPLSNLLPPADLLALLLAPDFFAVTNTSPHYQLMMLQVVLVNGFKNFVCPYLDDAAMEQLRWTARQHINPSLWSQSQAPTLEQGFAYRLAPVLGLHRELQILVNGWPDNLFPRCGGGEDHRRTPRQQVFGLGDPWLVEQHVRRLGLTLRNDVDARSWLAHTGISGVDYLVAEIRAARQSIVANRLIEVLCLVQAPSAAKPLLELRLDGMACPAMRAWFDREVGNAVAGLLPHAGGRGKFGDAVRAYLRDVKRRGLAGVIEEQLGSVEEGLAAKIQNSILDVEEVEYPLLDERFAPDWLRQALMLLPAPPPENLPEWLSIDDLPPLLIEGRRIDAITMGHAVRTLQAGKIDNPSLLLSGLRAHAEPRSREAVAWRLFEQWQSSGAPTRDAWALNAVGLLGGDESAQKLATLVRDGSGRIGRLRAWQALECLRAIGTPVAIQHLAGLSRLLRSRPLRERARSLCESLASQRGLSPNELEDRTVPSLGFDHLGGPTFDFGPRCFQALLAPGLRLVLRDDAGRLREDLPACNKREADGGRRAMMEWRLLKKEMHDFVKEQGARLERAMVAGRRWPLAHFQTEILQHPLLSRLGQLLLWGCYDEKGRLFRTFRLTDELRFTDAFEAPVDLGGAASVRIVHPIELDAETRAAWTATWNDHELIPPFSQLGRRLYVLNEAEKAATEIVAFRGRRIPALTLAGLIKAQDWQSAMLAGSRRGVAHLKVFPGSNVTAVVFHPDVGAYAYPNHRAEQELSRGFFVRGRRTGKERINSGDALPLGQIDDLVRSEVCELMALLFSKGKD